MLAHLATTALRATSASGPIVHTRFPSVRLPIWALVTCPPDLSVAVFFDVNVSYVSMSIMILLLL